MREKVSGFPEYKSASLEIAEVQTSVGLVYR